VTLRAIGVITVVALLVALGISSLWPWTAERHMSAYGNDWDDVSYFRRDLDKTGYTTMNILSSPMTLETTSNWQDTVLVVAGVERPYTDEEAQAIYRFLERGGKLVLADDRGHSDPLLKELVGDVKVNRSKLYSPSYVKNPDFIETAGYIDSGPVIDKRYTVMTNKPATFEGAIVGTIFLNTDNRSWLDVNNNKEKDLAEHERYFIIGFFFTGNAFLSDPSVFINDMWVRDQNAALGLDIIAAMLPKGGTVIFDESRHISSDAGQRAEKQVYDIFLVFTYDNYARAALITMCIAAVLLYLRFVKLPSDWAHMPNLDVPWLLNYKEGHIGSEDALRIRTLLENKVRVALCLSNKEFKLRKTDLMASTVKDELLLRFWKGWDAYGKEELEPVLERLSKFEVEPVDLTVGGGSR